MAVQDQDSQCHDTHTRATRLPHPYCLHPANGGKTPTCGENPSDHRQPGKCVLHAEQQNETDAYSGDFDAAGSYSTQRGGTTGPQPCEERPQSMGG